MNWTADQIDLWERMCQRACGLCCELFKPREIQTIQDFIETGRQDLAKDGAEEPAPAPAPAPPPPAGGFPSDAECAVIVRSLAGRGVSMEPGWNGNPDNQTVHITLFFGKTKLDEFYKPDAHGHAGVPVELLRLFGRQQKGC